VCKRQLVLKLRGLHLAPGILGGLLWCNHHSGLPTSCDLEVSRFRLPRRLSPIVHFSATVCILLLATTGLKPRSLLFLVMDAQTLMRDRSKRFISSAHVMVAVGMACAWWGLRVPSN
jgi:hypothetical protein